MNGDAMMQVAFASIAFVFGVVQLVLEPTEVHITLAIMCTWVLVLVLDRLRFDERDD